MTAEMSLRLLEKCVLTGDFGGIRLGMTREEIRDRLGDPDDMGGTLRKYRTPSIWKYGEVELFFGRDGFLYTFYCEIDQGDTIKIISVDEKGAHTEFHEAETSENCG